jgi:signal transduction histidine kinase
LYGSLFLVSGVGLLAVTYALLVQAFVGKAGASANCRIPGSGCSVIGARQARALALQAHAATLHDFVSRSAMALGVLVVISIALGWFVAGRVLRPLRTITAAAREISAANLGERLALSGPDDELKELGDTFDELLARLEASFSAQRQFIANASHELRTPLARQRVISQVALADPEATVESLRAAHERVLASGTEQQQLIDALLMLARGQASLDRREPFDLASITGQVLAARQADLSDLGLTLDSTLDPAPAVGDSRLAERLTANLVDNALRHNVPGGRVEVSTRTVGQRAMLSVGNSGPVIVPDAVDRLFRPFERLGADRTGRVEGLGLGLSIVQAIAQSHKATVTVRAQPEGGLVVAVVFPEPTAPRS